MSESLDHRDCIAKEQRLQDEIREAHHLINAAGVKVPSGPLSDRIVALVMALRKKWIGE